MSFTVLGAILPELHSFYTLLFHSLFKVESNTLNANTGDFVFQKKTSGGIGTTMTEQYVSVLVVYLLCLLHM